MGATSLVASTGASTEASTVESAAADSTVADANAADGDGEEAERAGLDVDSAVAGDDDQMLDFTVLTSLGEQYGWEWAEGAAGGACC